MSRLECSHKTDPKIAALKSLGFATLSRHPLPPSAFRCLELLMNAWKKQAGEPLFILIFKGLQDMSQKRRPGYILQKLLDLLTPINPS